MFGVNTEYYKIHDTGSKLHTTDQRKEEGRKTTFISSPENFLKRTAG